MSLKQLLLIVTGMSLVCFAGRCMYLLLAYPGDTFGFLYFLGYAFPGAIGCTIVLEVLENILSGVYRRKKHEQAQRTQSLGLPATNASDEAAG